MNLKKASNLHYRGRSWRKSSEYAEEVSSLEEKVEKIYDYQIDPDEVAKKLTDPEDRSRRNNLQIDGVAEENGES